MIKTPAEVEATVRRDDEKDEVLDPRLIDIIQAIIDKKYIPGKGYAIVEEFEFHKACCENNVDLSETRCKFTLIQRRRWCLRRNEQNFSTDP